MTWTSQVSQQELDLPQGVRCSKSAVLIGLWTTLLSKLASRDA